MFFRGFPREAYPSIAGQLAYRFHWGPGEIDALDGEELVFWLERLEEVVKAAGG